MIYLSNSGGNFSIGFLKQHSSTNQIEMIVLTESSTPIQFNIPSQPGYNYIANPTTKNGTYVIITRPQHH